MEIMLVGFGGWGAGWADVVRAARGVELAAVVDPSADARRRATEVLGLRRDQVLADFERALEAVAAEAVLIVSPPSTHHGLAVAALEAGRHVLLEKPLATTLDDALAVVAAAARAGRHALVSQNYRFHPPVLACQQIVASGVLGELVGGRVACRRDIRDQQLPADDFRYAMAHPYVLDMAIHHFDLLRAVTGQEIREIHARSWPVPDSPFVHHPGVTALLTLESGAAVVYDGDWAPRGPETSWNGEWELVGREARMTLGGGVRDERTGDLRIVRRDGSTEPVQIPPLAATGRAGTLQALRRAIEDGDAPAIAAHDNVRSLVLVLACIESIEAAAPVDVPALLRQAQVTARWDENGPLQ
jgi:predicted dehydrogenase